MNKLLVKSLLLLAGLCASISLNAQDQRQNSKLLLNNNACNVVDIGLGDALPWDSNSLRSFQIGWNNANGEDLIYKGEGIYVFRLAACITNAEFRSRFQSKKELVYSFWNSLEEGMNKIYERDCGIRFKVIKDDRLILSDKEHKELTGVDHNSYHTKGTKIITEAIGVENYEVGILIIPTSGKDPNAGVAVLRGVLSDNNKASARATSDTRIVAHEIGHMFGSLHTHVINPKGASIYTEGGSGQSIMSYGSPVNFFSLPSIQMIRKTLQLLPYYTDENRTNKISQNKKELNSAPYLEKSNIDKPELLSNEINKEYKVTPGTYYQFHIPVKNKKDSYLYFAHSFDPTNSSQTPHNIQRCYGPSKSNFIMFQPRYKNASSATTNQDGELDAILSESDNFPKKGLYTYMLSAFHNGQHDVQTVKLRIVPGKKFEIKKVKGINTTWYKANNGDPLTIEWEPCTDVYGRDSKVRILLSDDFGQSFKYVLADNVPNSGVWDGYVPYVNVGSVSILDVSGIRGGVLKIEVIGEAAYTVSHTVPYIKRGSSNIGTGGFTIDKSSDKAVSFSPMPEVYLEVEDESQVPQSIALTASYGSRKETVQVQERREENLIYRTWTANIEGKKSVYTQLIKILSFQNNDNIVLKSRIKAIQEMAKDLYDNIGNIGYPYGQLDKSKIFRSAYDKVFNGDNIKSSVTQSDYDELLSSLQSINSIEDWQLVKPIAGHSYKIASYSYIFGDKIYNYFKAVGGGEETDKKNESEASDWKLKYQDGIYKFSNEGRNLYLESIVNYDGGIMLHKGDTWGSFIPFARNSEGAFYYIRADKKDGQLKRYSFALRSELNDYITNVNAMSVSTDFVFKPVANSYKVYLEKGNWTNAKAILKQNGQTKEITSNKEQNGRFEFDIPADYFLASIEFVNGSNNSKTPLNYLGGVSAVYNQVAKRVYDLSINNGYSTLYLAYPVSIPQGANAYIASAKPTGNGTIKEYSLELYKLNGNIPANTAVIIRTENSSTKTIRFEEADLIAPQESNSLVGSLENVETTDQNDSFLYFDISAPSSLNDTYIFTPINKSKIIDRNKAYLRLYAYKTGERIEKVVLPHNQFGNTTPPVPAPEMATITIPSTNGGSISLANGANPSAIEVGTKVSLNISPKAGYKLISIRVNGNDITNSKEFIVQSGENKIEVVWQEMARIILPTAEGGTISLPNDINPNEVAVGTNISINVSPKEGYKLVSIKVNDTDITISKEFTVQSGENRIEVVWQKTTSIDLRKDTENLKVYPNPTKDFVILSDAKIGAEYKIYTINGVCVGEGTVKSEKHYISISELPSGIYIIRIDDKSIKIEKI